jgi:hypothetical protein
MENMYQSGQNPPPKFGVDWIMSGFTPNIATGSPGAGVDITSSVTPHQALSSCVCHFISY